MLLPILLAAPFLAALLLALMPGAGRRASALVVGTGAAIGLLALAALGPSVFAGEVPRFSATWLPQLGLAFSLRLDGFAWMFALLVLGIGALIVVYAYGYLAEDDPPRRFFASLALFMGAMLGVVVSGNLLLLVVFWELTALASFLLIGYWNQRREARRGARMALAITGAGGLALLAGALMIGRVVGSFELDVVLASGAELQAHPLYGVILACVLLGAFAKSAQFPLHFWLPQAMAAPTPVSAYLHSATMVKCGVFLLARLHPALAGSEAWFLVVSGVGLVTLLYGAWRALFQQDLKALLAYSTISHLGLITLLFGLGTPMALVAGVFHLLNHAVFKASLFMAAGIVEHETGTRDLRKLGGLARLMPVTAGLVIVASLAMAGVPLTSGFLSKEMFFVETLGLPAMAGLHLVVPLVALLAATVSVAYSLRMVHGVFFGRGTNPAASTAHEPSRALRLPVEVLVLLVLAVGLLPSLVIGPLLALGAQGAVNAPLPAYTLALWHGFNLPLLMSVAVLAGGAALWAFLQRGGDFGNSPLASIGTRVFDAGLQVLVGFAALLTRALESRRLPAYLGWVLAATVLAGGLAFVDGLPASGREPLPAPPGAYLLWAVGLVACVAVVLGFRHRLRAVLLVGAVGLCVSMAFVFLAAPDLALTQLMVEVLSILLLLLALRHLPVQSPRERAPLSKAWHAALALGGGAVIGGLAYAVMTQPLNSIAEYFLRTSKSEGGGLNVVNVIIVDYRALDTLGEIAVVGIAAVIIAALLSPSKPDTEMRIEGGRSLMLQLVAQWLLPLGVAVALYFFLRGHNAPGGGFIAALVLVAAFYLQTLAHGAARAERMLPRDWTAWIGIGLLAATLTGLGAFAFGHPFLTSSTPYVVLPGLEWLGAIPFASAMGFDTGVFVTVTGGLMLVLVLLSRLQREDAR